MAIERALVIVKPDGVRKAAIDTILDRYKGAGLEVVCQKKSELSMDIAKSLYKEHESKPFFDGLVLALSSGPCIILLLKGENAIATVRRINGATNPDEAEPGTIRGDIKSAGGPFNIVHGSEAVDREGRILFGDQEWNVLQAR